MSLAAMHWARQSLKTLPADVKTPSRLALMLLADYADEEHVCWPSIKNMALEMGCSTRSVQRAVDGLESRGLLMVEQRLAANGRQQSNRYRLAVGGGCQSVTPTTSIQSGEGDNLTPSEGDKLTGGGDTTVRGRVTPVSPLESTTRPYNPSHSREDAPSLFEQAAQRTDDGDTLPTDERQQPMTLDWQPDAEQFAVQCQRRGLPAATEYTPADLADFTAHFADQPKRMSDAAWTNRFARWVHENRQRQQTQQPTPGGAHAQRKQRTPARRVTAAEARERDRQRQQAGGGNVFDGEWSPGR